MKEKKTFGTRELVTAAVLLAICLVAQLFKNTSVFITGPVINACLILCILLCGWAPSIILCILTPITSAFITGAPIMQAVPVLMPLIMVGNAILVIFVGMIGHKTNVRLILGMGAGSLVKAIVMGLTISYGVLPHMLPEKMAKMLPALQAQFSIVQLVTALIGSVYAFIIWTAWKKAGKN